jgi:hypothetical protein
MKIKKNYIPIFITFVLTVMVVECLVSCLQCLKDQLSQPLPPKLQLGECKICLRTTQKLNKHF